MKYSFDSIWNAVPSINLSDDDKKFLNHQLANANKLLRKWHMHVPRRKTKFFRNCILNKKYDVVMKNFIPYNLHEEFLRDADIINKIKTEKLQRFGNQTVEQAVVSGYHRLLIKIIRTFKKRFYKFKNENLFDIYQDSYIKLIDAIYSYTDESKCFSTFASVVLQNYLYSLQYADNLVKIPDCEKRLLKKYRSMVKQNYIDNNELINVEEFINRENLDSKNIKKLQKVIVSNTVSNDVYDQERDTNCIFIVTNEIDNTNLKNKFCDILNNVDLTDNEKEVLEHALNFEMEYGWQSRLAKKMNLSKMRISQLIKTALGKIKKHILSNKQKDYCVA